MQTARFVQSPAYNPSTGAAIQPLRILFTAWGNPGNLSPLLTAARRLAERGHDVRVLGDADSRPLVEQAGFGFHAWRRPQALTPPDPAGDDPERAEVEMMVTQLMFGSALDYALDTMEELRNTPADILVTTDFLLGTAIAAEALGLPCVLLSPHVSLRPLEGVPCAGCGVIPGDDPSVQAEERAARTRFESLMNGCLPVLNRARAAFALPPLGHAYEHFDRADRVLLGLADAFDFPATRLPPNVRYVGPLLDPPSWSQPWTAPWSDKPVRPRLLVSLSTSFQNQASLLRRVIATLGTMDVDAVVTAGPAMESEEFPAPANVSVIHSAPHDAVMREVSLVVTHGGHGTVARSLVNGVPLLVLPMGRDQADNAARVVARGAGLALPHTAEEAAIASAVRRLVAEPRFRASAVSLGACLAADAGSPVLVREIEALDRRQWLLSA